MDEIKVGDVFKHNEAKRYCAVIVSVYETKHSNGVDFVTSNMETVSDSTDFFLREYHKIGHIDKFAEALKELEEMEKSGGD